MHLDTTTLVTVEIDRNACIGYGECVTEDPDAVELDRDGCARLLVPNLEPARARRLCAVCPANAISIVRGG